MNAKKVRSLPKDDQCKPARLATYPVDIRHMKMYSDSEVMLWVFGMLVIGAVLLGVAILYAEEILARIPLTF
jgi:hypothetical protein